MADQSEANSAVQSVQTWSQTQVYTMAVICLAIGLAFGYLLRGSSTTKASVPAPTAAATPNAGMPPQAMPAGGQPMPSLDDMKRMADKKAEPLLAQLKSDPNNPKLLVQIGSTYKAAHQFDQAAKYFQQALDKNPKDIALRDEVGGALYYAGNTDKAIATFEEGLKYAPNDISTLYDLGVMKLQKKNDAKGAIAMWDRLLKSNPNLPADKKAQVEKMIADAKSHTMPVIAN